MTLSPYYYVLGMGVFVFIIGMLIARLPDYDKKNDSSKHVESEVQAKQ